MIKLTTELRETAIAIAQEAGQAIMQVYSNGFDVTLKDDDSPVTAADLAADRVIQQGPYKAQWESIASCPLPP